MTRPVSPRTWARSERNAADWSLAPEPILGEESGDAEWERQRKPVDVFLHTSSYETFKKPYTLFLFGKRGTGKTSLIRMLQWETREGEPTDYSCAWTLDQDDAYTLLAHQIRSTALADLPDNELVRILQDQWEWILTVSAMHAVLWQTQMRDAAPGQESDIRTIEKYLRSIDLSLDEDGGVFDARSPVETVLDLVLAEAQKVQLEGAQYAAAVVRLFRGLATPDYRDARTAMRRVLSFMGRPALVTIDSLDDYNLEDKVARCVAAAAMESALKFYNRSETSRVRVKIAFPSEIFPKLPVVNAGKANTKSLFIHWRYGDLVSLLAKRYAANVLEGEDDVDLRTLDDTAAARNFLYGYMPRKIRTHGEVEFDTLAYLLRHTHKKPREVIVLMNVILSLARRDEVSWRQLTPEVIKNGTHARLDLLVSGALDAMKHAYGDLAREIVSKTLTGAPNHFDESTLDRQLGGAAALRKKANLESQDCKRLLIEAGAIGCVVQRGQMRDGHEIWECTFQYQVPDRLTLNRHTRCVVHPMFYEVFSIEVDRQVFVYPVANEDEERQTLTALGLLPS